MQPKSNIWKNDTGFIWMLAISIAMLISSQLTTGLVAESKFFIRLGFFFFTIVAVMYSALNTSMKLFGYVISAALLLLAIIMVRFETKTLELVYSLISDSFLIFIIGLMVNQIFAGGSITGYKIGGGIAVYILLGHLWASLYLTLYILQPDSFQYGGELIASEEALKQLSYFSFVSLTTIGYGDITALNSFARILVILEGLTGQLFPAIFIAKLVSLQIEGAKG